jgi:hypothetical protein
MRRLLPHIASGWTALPALIEYSCYVLLGKYGEHRISSVIPQVFRIGLELKIFIVVAEYYETKRRAAALSLEESRQICLLEADRWGALT